MCVAFADVLHMDPTRAAGSGSIIRGHAPRNRRRSHAKFCERCLLHRLRASLGRLSWADARKHAATPLAIDATATPNSPSTVSCAVCVPVSGGYPGPTPENTEVNALGDADRGVTGTSTAE